MYNRKTRYYSAGYEIIMFLYSNEMPIILVDFDQRLHIAINTVHLFYVVCSTKFIDYYFASRNSVILYVRYFFFLAPCRLIILPFTLTRKCFVSRIVDSQALSRFRNSRGTNSDNFKKRQSVFPPGKQNTEIIVKNKSFKIKVVFKIPEKFDNYKILFFIIIIEALIFQKYGIKILELNFSCLCIIKQKF